LEVRVLKRGIELLGSERALARRLRVPLPDLMMWICGNEKPTRVTFMAAVDLLIEAGDTSGLGELHSLSPEHDDPADFGRSAGPRGQ